MPLTRAALEGRLVSRTRSYLQMANMATTTAGTNTDLDDTLISAMLDLGYSLADQSAVTDADLAAVPSDETNRLVDVAQLRLLETIRTNLGVSSQSMGPLSKSYNLGGLDKAISDLRSSIMSRYTLFVPTITAGVIVTSTRPSADSGVD